MDSRIKFVIKRIKTKVMLDMEWMRKEAGEKEKNGHNHKGKWYKIFAVDMKNRKNEKN